MTKSESTSVSRVAHKLAQSREQVAHRSAQRDAQSKRSVENRAKWLRARALSVR